MMPMGSGASPPPQPDLGLLGYLTVYAIGFFSQLFRTLMAPDYQKNGAVRILAGAAAAGIASIVAVSLAAEMLGHRTNFVIAISGIAGWLGGNVMSALATSIEERLGFRLTPPAADAAPAPPGEAAPAAECAPEEPAQREGV